MTDLSRPPHADMVEAALKKLAPPPGVPKDFDRALWLDGFAFEGLIGAALAHGLYSELFRSDGFAKPIAELAEDPRIARLMAKL